MASTLLPHLELAETLLVLPCSGKKTNFARTRDGNLDGDGASVLDRLPQPLAEGLRARRTENAIGAKVDESTLLPAIERYVGHLYVAARPAFSRLSRSGTAVLIISGGYGIVLAHERIKDVAPPVEVDVPDEERLEIVAWLDRFDSAYARGERVRMFVRTSRDAYVTILNVDPAGETTVLFPNRYQSDNRVRAARAVEIPAPGSGFQVVVRGPVGTELLKVIASTEPLPLFEAMQMADIGAFRRLRAEPQGIARDLVLAFGNTRSSAGSAPLMRRRPRNGPCVIRRLPPFQRRRRRSNGREASKCSGLRTMATR